MTKRITGLTAIAVGAILGTGQSAVAQDPVVTVPRHHILLIGMARARVELALDGAIRRLSTSRCQQLFEDFTDRAGRRLAVNLAASGKAPALLLGELYFFDADETTQCRTNEGLAAFTEPESRVIHVCTKRFGRSPNPARQELVLIHELLHALGLGENPPHTTQITKAVMNRCG